MNRTSSLRRRLAALTLTAGLALAAGCGYDATVVPGDATATESDSAPAPAPAPASTCVDDETSVRSYAPTGQLPPTDALPAPLPAGSTMKEIRDRGFLIAGIASDSYLLSSRNPFTGVIEGFDNDMVNAVATAIFGTAEGTVQLRVITPADRIPLLVADEVDIVVRNMTVNCSRWEQIAFSAEYYRSGQKVLVGRGAGIETIADLSDKRVCAPTGTTSIENIRKFAPDAIPVSATNDTFCMVKFQNGEADALSTDDTVLAGLAAQDPYAVVLEGEPLTAEPYGIGVNAENVDLVRFINAVLERMRADGSWQVSYQRWLQPTLGQGTGQPVPLYGRER
ncbi:MAG: glutamate ABC transporter substrate-binding protein [Nocardioides sp.]|nr:glutamate ABC transporter substrate-binding protein [Nocardioides sp.]